ncbi:hypothetical protein RHA1_ro02678 [Rhodococcus jostii RHA1]|uniref:Uncharacterized protein n=1 Tax=Rhodococcus jostii (strain RHA1) TaxID=101510 RepID=Q0SDA3_RHOJR|nr:hypothetical protein RHA1_ro02678 [Rhodococcus jostii RHA1]
MTSEDLLHRADRVRTLPLSRITSRGRRRTPVGAHGTSPRPAAVHPARRVAHGSAHVAIRPMIVTNALAGSTFDVPTTNIMSTSGLQGPPPQHAGSIRPPPRTRVRPRQQPDAVR